MNPEDLTKDKVNQETSKIAWSELQRFFAQGLAANVTPDLDLVEVTDAFSKDDKVRVEHWARSPGYRPASNALV